MVKSKTSKYQYLYASRYVSKKPAPIKDVSCQATPHVKGPFLTAHDGYFVVTLPIEENSNCDSESLYTMLEKLLQPTLEGIPFMNPSNQQYLILKDGEHYMGGHARSFISLQKAIDWIIKQETDRGSKPLF